MARKTGRTEEPLPPDAPEPVSVVEGVPDRSRAPAAWKYLLLAGVFSAWIGFLLYCLLAGGR